MSPANPPPDSPWQRALGAEMLSLHPRLHDYFAAIPMGHVGRGSGTFSVVGTPRRWLWPVFRILARHRILFPVWAREVPFFVENRRDGSSLRATRTFRFDNGEQQMVDVVSCDERGLIDHLGDGGILATRLSASVAGGALRLVSTSARWGWFRIPFAPQLRLTERFDDITGMQHVNMSLESALLGRLYEYSGYFTYKIEAA